MEVEYLATAKGVVEVIEALRTIDDQSKSLLSTLRIIDLDKVTTLSPRQKPISDSLLIGFNFSII